MEKNTKQPVLKILGNRHHLKAGVVDEYLLELAAGQVGDVAVDQQGVDVVAGIVGPDGQTLLEIDSPIGSYGVEELCFLSARSSSYRVRVRSLEPTQSGSYTIRLTLPPHAPSLADRACAAAGIAFNQGELEWRKPGHKGVFPLSALASYEKARSLWHLSGRPHSEAAVLNQIGQRWAELGFVSRAAASFDRSLSVARRGSDRLQEIDLLNRLGIQLMRLGELSRAESILHQALSISEHLSHRAGEAAAWNNLALLAKSRGKIQAAIQEYGRARAIFHTLGERVAEATVLMNLGRSYAEIGAYRDGYDQLSRALSIQKAVGRTADHAPILAAMGWVRHLEGKSEQAIGLFRKALAISRESSRQSDETAILDQMGSVYRQQRRWPEAIASFRAALTLAEKLGNRRNAAHTFSNLGWTFLDIGQAEAAKRELVHAVELLSVLGDKDGLAHALVGRATAERRQGDLDAALNDLERVTRIVGELRTAALRSGLLPPSHPLWPEYSEQLVDLLIDLDRLRPGRGYSVRAAEVADQAHAQNLVLLFHESQLGFGSGALTSQLLDQERLVFERLAALEERRRSLIDSPSPPAGELAEVERAYRAFRLRSEILEQQVRAQNPRSGELRDPQPLSLAAIQRLLDPDAVLLNFALGAKRSFLFVIGRKFFTYRELPDRDRVEAVASTAYEGLRGSRGFGPRGPARIATATLAQMLLGDLLKDLRPRHLVIVPDGFLHYFPFAVLPQFAPTAGHSAQEAPEARLLLDDFALSLLPSAAALQALRIRHDQSNHLSGRAGPCSLAVLADPVYSLSDPRIAASNGSVSREAEVSPTQAFKRLPFSRAEALGISGFVPTTRRRIALDFAASLSMVRSDALSRCRVLHFATHATIDEERPELSEIKLSTIDPQGRPIDGSLRLQEIYTLRLPAELVVLSGCRTALGQRVRGDGIQGLTRGFSYAGATRLVVSLWDVDDRATSELMPRFYRGLFEQSLPPAAALRQAQLWLRHQKGWEEPYFWAPFVLEGDWRLLPTQPFPADGN